ncbi:MAG: polysaccharide biosynthesis C-terminal domain-containing protein [Gammaproteobacteria bacterium]|nr:polysaccharide biosynthesis C-terminal domain-containing protein [Gammaproteobacteria bacterium]
MQNKFSKNLTSMLFSRVLVVFLGIVSMVIISRVLGPSGQGEYSLAMLIANVLFIVFNVGLPSSLIFFVGKYGLNKIGFSVLVLYLLASLAGVILYAFVIVFYSEVYFAGLINDLLLLCGLIFLAKMAASYYQSVFLAEEKIFNFNLAVVIQHLTFFLFVVILFMNREYFSVVNILIVFLLSIILSIIYSIKTSEKFHMEPVLRADIKPILKYGLNSHFNNIVAFLIYRTDLVVINYYLGVEAVGLYAIGILIVENILLVATIAGTTLLTRLVNSESIDFKLISYVCKLVIFTTLCAVLVLYFSSEFLVVLVFGEKFVGSVSPLQILLFGTVFSAQSKILANYFAASNQLKVNSYVALVLFFMNIIFNLWLVPLYGLIGAAMATVIVQLINFVIKNFIFARKSSLSLFENIFITREFVSYVRLFICRFLN